MKEISVKNETAGSLRVFINGVPNLKLMSKNETDNLMIALELKIAEFYLSKDSLKKNT